MGILIKTENGFMEVPSTVAVDNAPIENSTNPISSGGVFNTAKNIEEKLPCSVMPIANADNSNIIIQYIGETNTDYTNGYFYKCIYQNDTWAWARIDVQPGGAISATVSPITGGHRITISSTDSSTTNQTFDVMDGTEIIQTTSDDRTVTFLASDWQGASAPYTQTVTVSGITSNTVPTLGLSVSSTVETGLEELSQWGRISRATTGTNTITAYCYKDKPTIDLNVNVKVV